MSRLNLEDLAGAISRANLVRQEGRIIQAIGTVLEADLPGVRQGALVEVEGTAAEIIGFRENRALLMALGPLRGVGLGRPVKVRSAAVQVRVGPGLVGRILGPLGEPIDGRSLEECPFTRHLDANAPHALRRTRILEPLETGMRAMDGLLSLGLGQRVCILAGSGIGKSTFLGMLARHTKSDVCVVALVGERGREVREFLERDLGPEGLARAVLVIATSDASPILQVKAVHSAMAIAEHFRDQGRRVLMLVDSLTRLAMAQRQIGLAAGEPPTTRGYTPSVFALLPRLLERAGPGAGTGSITGVFTVLVEADDVQDPIGDAVRGILDGHVVLSRKLASHGHYPAIDILGSLSRTMPATTPPDQQKAATRIRDLLATWAENEELIRLGVYKTGTDPAVDAAVAMKGEIDSFLRQDVADATPLEETRRRMKRIVSDPRAAVQNLIGA